MTRLATRRTKKTNPTGNRGPHSLVAFETPIGWIGFSHSGGHLKKVKFGYPSQKKLLEQFEDTYFLVEKPNLFERELTDRLRNFAAGQTVDFSEFEIDDDYMTPFQKTVTNACRNIPYGTTVSYGELAELAGSPKAARAVGSVMKQNRYPLIVPCHRVVSSGRKLGGFSSPKGTSMKVRLLQMERAEGFC